MSRPTPAPYEDDPENPKVAASALDLLLLELVPLAQRITERLLEREHAVLEEYKRNRLFNNPATAGKNLAKGSEGGDGEVKAVGIGGVESTVAVVKKSKKSKGKGEEEEEEVDEDARKPRTSLGFPVMAEETRERVFWRLEGMGYRVGQGIVERFSPGKPRPTTSLEAIKFVCKDLWILVFRKQIDNLKTNHRGIFVLTDGKFQPLGRMSVDRRTGIKGAEETVGRAQTWRAQYLYFPCGVIRGALAGLGIEATVEASSTEIPIATFQIKQKGAKA
ncbi:hypothetical protein LTR62_001571 [Meristemomyces frigidus]|uniref:Trafficking protein particle complex subunit 6B n=1 Tax=Meristemomyces frigidus TaxID=1508187 RepID=A0AAN7T7X8_9PEZI|nr:hypothetical protein LTR62_001571 [Meristemomyces frigidus]